MRDKHYKGKKVRLSEEVWKKLKEKRRASGKTWNLFIKDLIYDETMRPVPRKSLAVQTYRRMD